MSDQRDPQLNLGGIEEQYEILGELGRGGTSIVYLALDRELGREVALKVIREQYQQDAEAMARFEREARTLAQLEHPNIITLYAAWRLAEGGLVLVMQLTHGLSLRELLRREGAFSYARTEQVLRDLASALAYLHRRGIVHRDIKPENIFFDEQNNRTLLSDFGIAKAYDGRGNVTLTGVVVGTPAYMSPEQIDGAALDGQSDLYSLGLVGWEMLTGQRPWEGESLYGIVYKQKSEPLPALTAFRPGIPEHLRLAIERALQKDRLRRYLFAEDILEQLDAGVSLMPQSQAGTALAADLPNGTHAGATPEDTATIEFRRDAVVPAAVVPGSAANVLTRSRVYLAAAGVALLAGGAVTFPLINTTPPPASAEEAAQPPLTEANASDDVAAASRPTPRPVSSRSLAATGAQTAAGTRELPAEETPPAIPNVDLALSRIPEPEPIVPAPIIQPVITPMVASSPSHSLVLSPDVAPVLRNHRAVRRQIDRSYSTVLRDSGISGTVVLSLLIDERGRVIAGSVSNSSGHEQLDAAALNVGQSMRFTPAQHDGRPVRTRIGMPLVFDPSAAHE